MAGRPGDRAVVVDAAAVALISAGILAASDRLLLMTVLVPTVIAGRFVAWWRLSDADRRPPLGTELLFFALCTALGAFNDWNSVVRHGVYAYGVPCFFPELSTIPLWMLLYWGLILRFVATLGSWSRIGGSPVVRDTVRLPGLRLSSSRLKVLLSLLLVLGTRQAIYRLWDEPTLSWLPFAAALLLWALLFGADRGDRRLALLFVIGGPLIEVLYIQIGGLHRYAHGLLFGVPLWIALWWVLAVLIWRDLSARLLGRIARGRAVSRGGSTSRTRTSGSGSG